MTIYAYFYTLRSIQEMITHVYTLVLYDLCTAFHYALYCSALTMAMAMTKIWP